MPDKPPDALLDTDEAAAECDEPAWLMRAWRRLGEGPRTFRLGRRFLYRLRDLRRWVGEGKPVGTLGELLRPRA